MAQSAVPHLLLVNLGTPEAATPESVREFLEEFLGDPAVVDLPRWLWMPILKGIILRTRPKRVALQYASIWSPEGSPLRAATEFMVRALREIAADHFTVSSAYRYGEPSLDTAMKRLARETSGPIVVLPLFPQRTDATTGTAFRAAHAAARRAGIDDRLVERLIAPDDPGYIEAMAAGFQSAAGRARIAPEHLVISYHGIPKRYDQREGHTYTDDCEATTKALLAAIDWPEDSVTHAYQSKFGPEAWLTPATADVLEAASRPRRELGDRDHARLRHRRSRDDRGDRHSREGELPRGGRDRAHARLRRRGSPRLPAVAGRAGEGVGQPAATAGAGRPDRPRRR